MLTPSPINNRHLYRRRSTHTMLLGNIAGMDLPLVLVIAAAVIIGGNQIPKLARNIGGASREFMKAQQEAEADEEAAAVTGLPAGGATDDNITISRAELARLLDEKLQKGRG